MHAKRAHSLGIMIGGAGEAAEADRVGSEAVDSLGILVSDSSERFERAIRVSDSSKRSSE